MELDEKLQDFVKDGKNSGNVECCSCGSIIFRPQTAQFIHKEMLLPIMEKKLPDESDTRCDQINGCWVVDNMFSFENIGFSHAVGQTKYLACADCEKGPVGWHDIRNPTEFFIALSRVSHKN